MITCSLNQSKPYLLINIVYSHLKRRSAASASSGFLRKNTQAVNAPNAASQIAGASNAAHMNSTGEPWNSSPTRVSTSLPGST